MHHPEPFIRTFPSSDVAFRRAAERAAADASSPGEIVSRLRPAYPRVTIRERSLSDEPELIYVYRDGGFSPTRSDPWWTSPDIACARLAADTGRFVSANEHWGELLGGAPVDLIGRHYSEFVLGEARAAADGIFEALREDPVVRTDILVRRADGTTILLEIRAVRLDGEIEIAYRRSPIERRRRPRGLGSSGREVDRRAAGAPEPSDDARG
jgi:PAS domain S-box-containing protein